jgi:lysophospholipase L1-like esterase
MLLALLGTSADAKRPGRLLFIGDSITAAVYVAPEDRFPELVGSWTGLPVLNLGCPGATTRDWTPSSPASSFGCGISGAWTSVIEAAPVAEDTLVILLGANDSTGFFEFWPNTGQQGWWVGVEEYEGRTRAMLRAFPGKVLLLGPGPASGSYPEEARERLAGYAELVRSLHGEGRRVCWAGDLGEILSSDAGDMLDGIHPNEQGLRKIALTLETTLRHHVLRGVPCKPDARRE